MTAGQRRLSQKKRDSSIVRAVGSYVEDVRERRFPEEQHTYSMPDEELALFEEALQDVGRERIRG